MVAYAHAPNVLLLDFDGAAPSFVAVTRGLRELGLHATAAGWVRSTRHYHLVIYLREELSLTGCLFAQLYLGSDRARERCNFRRVELEGERDIYVNVLFSKKVKL